MIVVADTGPVNYLVLSGHIDPAHTLYGTLLLPPAVHREILDERAPAAVRQWAAKLPVWAEVRPPKAALLFPELGLGEREAISLALETKADFLLIDETAGRKAAVQNGVAVKGTLGILEDAANRDLVDFIQAVSRLRATKIFRNCSGGEPAKHAKYAKRLQELHAQSLGRFACFACFAG